MENASFSNECAQRASGTVRPGDEAFSLGETKLGCTFATHPDLQE